MRAAPAFELALGLSTSERSLIAALAGVVAAVLAAWVWSHVDAAAGPAGRGAPPWIIVLVAAASVGAWAGWHAAPNNAGTVRWHQGRWEWLEAATGALHEGVLQPRIDLGSWLLLVFRSHAGKAWWLTAGRLRAGANWHPLRATLFAPGALAVELSRGESTPR